MKNMEKIAIVTGSSGNLGKAVVERFITGGYKVIGTDQESPQQPAFGDAFEKVVTDLTNEADTAAFVGSVIEKYRNIDAAVLTVGGFAMGKVSDTSTAGMQEQYKLNFETAYNVARPVFAQMMKQNHGRIFLIGSRAGLNSKDGQGSVAYSLSKSLIFRLAEMLNLEAKGNNVVTSVVVPSTIDTPQNRKGMPEADFSKWVKATEIAEVIFNYTLPESAVLREPIIKTYGNA